MKHFAWAVTMLASLATSTGAFAQKSSRTEGLDGLKLGVGISATYDLGQNDRVSEATIINDIVQVTNQDNVRARIMLETHYFFAPEGSFLGLRNTYNPDTEATDAEWGIGPFVAVQPGSGEIIEAIGFGVMIGFRRKDDSSNSFNVGVGVAFDPNTRTLGDGFVAGQPPPNGETEIRYLEQEQFGLLLLTSFSF